MIEVHFYHLTRQSLEQVLPELLQKTLDRQWRAQVMASSEERVEALSQHLWTFRPDSFLPHGSAKDGHAESQPIWLTTLDDRPNEAQVLFLTDGAVSDNVKAYERVCELFDGNDPERVEKARDRWKLYKSLGYSLHYWMQGEKGWTKQAAS
jgi:DNA polymerase-3 subunit chi